MRNEIHELFKGKNIGHQFYKDLQNITFLKSCFSHWFETLNILNLKLRGRRKNICQLYSNNFVVEGFEKY